MNWSFYNWFRKIIRNQAPKGPRFKLRRVDNLPRSLRANTLYLVGDDECSWVAGMQCPCGCKETIQLNLVTDTSPCWKLRLGRKGELSLTPSVWRTVGCRSHFILHRSRVRWCGTEVEEWC